MAGVRGGGLSVATVDLVAMLNDLESDRVERKSSMARADKIREAICAFANDLPDHRMPGYVFVGVNDDGEPTGLAITDELLRSLADMRSDGNILPPPMMAVTKERLKGHDVAVVKVQPALSPPVRYRGRVYIRIGPRRGIATVEEERRLNEKRRYGQQPFDQQPCHGAAISDLDKDFFLNSYLPAATTRDVLRENDRALEDRLMSVRFVASDRDTPTTAGMLVCGLDPQHWYPGAYVQFLRVAGTDLSDDVLDAKRLDGTLYQQAGAVEELLKLHVFQSSHIGSGLQRLDTPDYPVAALRELIFNAIVHRTYEMTNAPVRITWYVDRVEILSPGGLYGQVTAENFDSVQDYRNPTIAEAMKVLGYVERFGVGIRRVRRLLTENGNPPPEFNFQSPSHVLVTVRGRQ